MDCIFNHIHHGSIKKTNHALGTTTKLWKTRVKKSGVMGSSTQVCGLGTTGAMICLIACYQPLVNFYKTSYPLKLLGQIIAKLGHYHYWGI